MAVAVALVGAVGALVVDWSVLGRFGAQVADSPGPLALALVAYLGAFVLRAAAWGPLLPVATPLKRRLGAILAMLAVNHAVPGPVGEVVRARLVSDDRPGGLSFRSALVSVVAARVADVGAIAVLAIGAAGMAGEAPAWMRLAAPGAALLPVAAWMVARRRGAQLRPTAAFRVAAYAVPSWFLECGVVLAVAHASGLQLSVPAAVLATSGGVLAQVAAVLPGGVGTYEAGVASVLVVLSVPAAEALGVATATHAVKFAFAFGVGGPCLLAFGGHGRRARTPVAYTSVGVGVGVGT